MCGIAGFVSFGADERVSGSVLLLTHALAHRGPDGQGYWFANPENNARGCHAYGPDTEADWRQANPQAIDMHSCPAAQIAFGHRRLSLTGQTKAGHQPMSCSQNRYTMVFNGEIYNYKLLAGDLPSQPPHDNLTNDGQALLAAFAHYGPGVLAGLHGMFAFAVYDSHTQTLFAARDIAGVKPFYFAHTSGFFAFASEPKALLQLPQLHCRPRTDALHAFIQTGGTEFESQSFFEQIEQLPAGHYLILNLQTGQKTLQSFREQALSPYIRPLPPDPDFLVDMLTNALSSRLQTHRNVGACLSGGLDSTGLVGLAAHKLSLHLTAFTACFTDKQSDESKWAAMAIKDAKVPWHRVWPQSDALSQKMIALSYIHDAPMQAGNTYTQYCVYEQAARMGMAVMIEGQGADELFGGYATHYNAYMNSLITQKKWKKFWYEYGFADNNFANRKNIWVNLAKIKSQELSSFLHANKADLPENIDQARYQDFFGPRLQTLLRAGDRNSMHFGIEARVPFADHPPIIGYALYSLSGTDLVQQGMGKYLLRQALAGYIPEAIRLRRDKKGFATPQKNWMLEDKNNLADLLVKGLGDYVADYTHIKNNWNRLCSEKNLSNARQEQYLWRVLALGAWLKAFNFD